MRRSRRVKRGNFNNNTSSSAVLAGSSSSSPSSSSSIASSISSSSSSWLSESLMSRTETIEWLLFALGLLVAAAVIIGAQNADPHKVTLRVWIGLGALATLLILVSFARKIYITIAKFCFQAEGDALYEKINGASQDEVVSLEQGSMDENRRYDADTVVAADFENSSTNMLELKNSNSDNSEHDTSDATNISNDLPNDSISQPSFDLLQHLPIPPIRSFDSTTTVSRPLSPSPTSSDASPRSTATPEKTQLSFLERLYKAIPSPRSLSPAHSSPSRAPLKRSSGLNSSTGKGAVLWNPVQVFGEAMTNGVEWSASAEERTKQMLDRWLDEFAQPHHPLGDPYLHFLLDPVTTKILLEYITRPSEKAPVTIDNGEKERGFGDAVAVRRSHQVMRLFVSGERQFNLFVKKRMYEIIDELFAVLKPHSLANLYHFARILQVLIRIGDQTFMEHFIDAQLWKNMLNFIHEPPIADEFLRLLACQSSDATYKRQFYLQLQEQDFFPMISRKIFHSDSEYICSVTSGFLCKMFEEFYQIEGTDLLFNQMLRSRIVEDLCTTTVGDSSLSRKVDCIYTLQQLIHYSSHRTEAKLNTSGSVAEDHTVVKDALFVILMQNLPLIATALEKSASDHYGAAATKKKKILFSSYEIQPFTVYHLLLLETISAVIAFRPDQAFSILSLDLWNLLIPWFFVYSHNNFFQTQFVKILYLVISYKHIKILEYIVTKLDFIAKMKEKMSSANSSSQNGNRGFVTIIVNLLRSAIYSEPNGPIAALLKTNQPWIQLVHDLQIAHPEGQKRPTLNAFPSLKELYGSNYASVLFVLPSEIQTPPTASLRGRVPKIDLHATKKKGLVIKSNDDIRMPSPRPSLINNQHRNNNAVLPPPVSPRALTPRPSMDNMRKFSPHALNEASQDLSSSPIGPSPEGSPMSQSPSVTPPSNSPLPSPRKLSRQISTNITTTPTINNDNNPLT